MCISSGATYALYNNISLSPRSVRFSDSGTAFVSSLPGLICGEHSVLHFAPEFVHHSPIIELSLWLRTTVGIWEKKETAFQSGMKTTPISGHQISVHRAKYVDRIESQLLYTEGCLWHFSSLQHTDSFSLHQIRHIIFSDKRVQIPIVSEKVWVLSAQKDARDIPLQ